MLGLGFVNVIQMLGLRSKLCNLDLLVLRLALVLGNEIQESLLFLRTLFQGSTSVKGTPHLVLLDLSLLGDEILMTFAKLCLTLLAPLVLLLDAVKLELGLLELGVSFHLVNPESLA